MKNIVILGSTGSIGTQALGVIASHPDKFKIVGLASGTNVEKLVAQVQKFHPEVVALKDRPAAESLNLALHNGDKRPKILWGEEGLCEVAKWPSAKLVLAAIVGAQGLKPVYAALEAGKVVALANKEAMVAAGPLMNQVAKAHDAKIIPVDSEHSAIHQVIRAYEKKQVRCIYLTASGGPFLRHSPEELERVTVKEALSHPNWEMGAKITIDSATLMNKGLEMIEAKYLFEMDAEKIRVLIHPQSIVHSLVEYIDGSTLAQLGVPDMRTPISYALAWPERIETDVKRLDLASVGTLTFLPPDEKKFQSLTLAREALKEGESHPTVLNAANEVAVQAFLDRKIPFPKIVSCVREVLEAHKKFPLENLEAVLSADRWARECCRRLL